MGLFGTIRSGIGNLRTAAQEYIETRVELLKVQAAEKMSQLLSNTIAWIVLACFMLFFLVFASIGLAWVLSEWTGRTYAGFFIVSGLYLLVGYGIFRGRERLLRRPLRDAIVRQLFEQKPEKQDNESHN